MRAVVAVGVFVAVTSCSMPAAPVPAPTPTSAPGSAAPTSPSANPDDVSCSSEKGTSATVRAIAAEAKKGPLLPAGVALFLVDARQKAAAPATDPALAVAQAELVKAIDDLDAQGEAGLPPGGNAAQNKVKLDVTRILSAVDAVDKACAARGAGH